MSTRSRLRYRLGRFVPAALLVMTAGPLSGAKFQFTIIDNPGVGFNDATPVAPVGGNGATTLGAQRLAALQAGAAAWEALLPGNRIIRVEAYHASLECGATFGVLGRGGATTSLRNFPNAPLLDTWYPPALADELAGVDHDASGFDIRIFFNINVDHDPACLGGKRFWYGVQGPPPAGGASFRDVARHELAHGLGFNTLVDPATGGKALGRDDVFMTLLENHGAGAWPDLADAQRAGSALEQGDVHWIGRNVVDAALDLLDAGAHPSGHVEVDAASAVHWSSDLSPDELMEPAASRTPTDAVTRRAIADLGYTTRLGDTSPCHEDEDTLCLGAGGRFEVETSWTNGAGASAPGNAVPFTRDSGLFYFFDAGNVELLFKVLDACALNGHLWVFYAATTDLEFDVRVRDTGTGAVKSYRNRRAQPAQTITDSGAFAVCSGGGAGSVAPELERWLERDERRAAAFGGGPATFPPAASSPAGRRVSSETTPASGDDVPLRAVPRRLGSNAAAGALRLEGSRYTMAAGLAGDVDGSGALEADEFFLLHGTPVAALFDGEEESLSPYGFGIGTMTRLDEEVRDLGNGRLQLVLTLRSTQGKELFPAGVSVDGVALEDLLVALGSRAGGDPLDFLNLGVASARIQMFAGAQRRIDSALPVGSFFPHRPWDGDLLVRFPGQAGRGIDRVELAVDVDVPIFDATPVQPFTCVANATTLCLANGRFQVKIRWQDFEGNSGDGAMVPIPGSGDSGLSYFFDADNLEVLIKVLDARVVNGHFWVFYAATTDVGLEITVTDVTTGRRRVYLNELGRTASAVTDTSAFTP